MAFSDNRFSSQQKQRIFCILTSLTSNSKDLKVLYYYYLYKYDIMYFLNVIKYQLNCFYF